MIKRHYNSFPQLNAKPVGFYDQWDKVIAWLHPALPLGKPRTRNYKEGNSPNPESFTRELAGAPVGVSPEKTEPPPSHSALQRPGNDPIPAEA